MPQADERAALATGRRRGQRPRGPLEDALLLSIVDFGTVLGSVASRHVVLGEVVCGMSARCQRKVPQRSNSVPDSVYR